MSTAAYTRCPIRTALDLIGGKWKLLILHHLADGPLRYGELRRRLDGPSDKVFTQQLRILEQDRLVAREDFGTAAPRVEYALTAQGRLALPLVEQLAAFAHLYEAQTKAVSA